MSHLVTLPPTLPKFRGPPSPLILCDRLIALAEQAGRAGYAATAEHLVHLAHSVFEERPTPT